MKFIVDECTGPAVARWLKKQGYDVFSVYEEARGIDDDSIVSQAFSEERIIITNDKDFGEKAFRDQKPHKGIILLRLNDERKENKIVALQQLLENYKAEIENHFVVVTEKTIRIVK